MRALLILSIFSIASASVPAPIKKVVAKENKKCVFPDDSENFEFIKLGKKNQNLRACKKKCENNDECVAMQYIPPRQCTLYYTDIEQMVNVKDPAPDTIEAYCGRAKMVTEDGPVLAPDTGGKEYVVSDYTKCGGPQNEEKMIRFTNTFQSQAACQDKCDTLKNCKSFQWNGKNNLCVIYKYRIKPENVESLARQQGPSRVCAVSVKVQAEPAVCVLSATLAFPYTDPDDASPDYYGYHTDYLSVYDNADYYYTACAGWSNAVPSWCKYTTDGPYYGANIVNYDDYYDDGEYVTKETITVSGAAGKKFDFYVSHFFLEKDYYREYYWNDHMLSAILHIENKSHRNQKQLSEAGWFHEVYEDISTHEEDTVTKNEDYSDGIVVTVSCNMNCFCQTSYAEYHEDNW